MVNRVDIMNGHDDLKTPNNWYNLLNSNLPNNQPNYGNERLKGLIR